MELFGREKIITEVDDINENNVIDVLSKAMAVHRNNSQAIDYLYNYYKGRQPILDRTKEVRPEICNRVVENRANEIVSFKVGYLCGDPIAYVSNDDAEDIGDELKILNSFMSSVGKENKDKELIEWEMICGTAYRMILPNEDGADNEEAPFEVITLDPREAFVIYSNKIGKKPLAAVYCTYDKDKLVTSSVYTTTKFFEITDNQITRNEDYHLGILPIIEYPANTARLGAFEIVVPLLDAINNVASNRLDGVEQFIQSLIIAVNCQFKEGTTANSIREAGMIVLNSLSERPAEFKILSEQLDQSQTQTLVDYLYEAVLTICGMPNRNGGTSTSDTGAAVLYRDGWSAAETRAKDTETIYKESEYTALKLVLRICRNFGVFKKIAVRDINIKFTRRITENASTRATILTTLLGSDKIAPRLAFVTSGLFSDPEAAYRESQKYADEQEKKQAEQNAEVNKTNNDNANGDTAV